MTLLVTIFLVSVEYMSHFMDIAHGKAGAYAGYLRHSSFEQTPYPTTEKATFRW